MYYKVVYVKDNRLLSATLIGRRDCVEYLPGEWVKGVDHPRISKGRIFVFDNFPDALRYAKRIWCSQIWKCEVMGEVDVSGEYLGYSYYDKLSSKPMCQRFYHPHGTRAFERVMLIERQDDL